MLNFDDHFARSVVQGPFARSVLRGPFARYVSIYAFAQYSIRNTVGAKNNTRQCTLEQVFADAHQEALVPHIVLESLNHVLRTVLGGWGDTLVPLCVCMCVSVHVSQIVERRNDKWQREMQE